MISDQYRSYHLFIVEKKHRSHVTRLFKVHRTKRLTASDYKAIFGGFILVTVITHINP